MFMQSVFQQNKPAIPATAKVIVVSDMFVEDYVGGAELTTQALIDSSPFEVYKLHSKDVNVDILKEGSDRFWIFGNFAGIDGNLIPTIVANLKYSVLEYDYKYCRYRSPEKHMEITKSPCDCHNQLNGKLISAFYYGAACLWWMSEKQLERYTTLFPFLDEKDNIVLSSVFSNVTLGKIEALRLAQEKSSRKGWIVLGSDSWIKGAKDAIAWCEENKLQHEVIWNQPYDIVLEKLAQAEGFVYLPVGGDTCPRMVIEAKLLGCKLHLNDNVQHKDEEWFATDDLTSIKDYLFTAKMLFWNGIKEAMNYRPKISGYTTTRNCVSQGYPFVESIRSMLQFCDEVCIVDGGSSDGTVSQLVMEFMSKGATGLPIDIERTVADLVNGTPLRCDLPEGKTIIVKVVRRDWDHPHFAVFDGMQKQAAREMCTGDFCWQMDSDEVVAETDVQKILDLCQKLPPGVDVLSLPVIEFWGGDEKVRIDVQPWKWRLTRNKKNIGHGIPIECRRTDEHGVFATEGTDGCDMIDLETGHRLPHVTFHNEQSERVRQAAMMNVPGALEEYERWFNVIVNDLPAVFHYSWYDIERKIRLYRDYWTRHWNVLYGKNADDTAENNMMFDVAWKDVTDDMIKARASELAERLGGWIWHRKWDGKTSTPSMKINKQQPTSMIKEKI